MEEDIKTGFLYGACRLGLSVNCQEGRVDLSEHQSILSDKYKAFTDVTAKYLNRTACFIKNYAFYEENEVRIVFESTMSTCLMNNTPIDYTIEGTTKLQLEKVDYQIKNRNLVPFVDMNFSKAVKDGIIQRVIIGPKAYVSVEELQVYLWNHGYDNIEVKKSEISYR